MTEEMGMSNSNAGRSAEYDQLIARLDRLTDCRVMEAAMFSKHSPNPTKAVAASAASMVVALLLADLHLPPAPPSTQEADRG